ncbi:MAG: hypothetical protein QXH42_05440 [Thermoplasmata archaeon]
MSDVDPQENMVTFYACPRDEKPYVQMAALEEGRYQEVGYLSLRTFINFSDVGLAARKAALEIDNNITMSLVGYSWLEEDKSWIVVIESGKVNVVINSQRYKHLGSYTKAFYINLGVSGTEEQVRDFATRFVKQLGRNPLEGIDWVRFEEAEIAKRSDAEATWRKYAGQSF